jgi:hypothetical protein
LPRTQPLNSTYWLKELHRQLKADPKASTSIFSGIEAAARANAINGAVHEMLMLIFDTVPNRALHDLANAARMRLAEIEKEESQADFPVAANYRHKVAAQALLDFCYFTCICRSTTDPDGTTHYQKI